MPAPAEPVTLACHAMATRFELVLNGPDPVSLRAAGEEALVEIERIENQLSLYRNTSEIAHVNAHAAREPVRVSPEVFRLLEQARELSAACDGAFDPTIAPLVRCWGFLDRSGKVPAAEALDDARSKVGFALVELRSGDRTVRFAREGVMLDLGAIGKGYAIERAAELLREAGVVSAILHGGTSTVQAIGRAGDGRPWKVAIERPPEEALPDSGPRLARRESKAGAEFGAAAADLLAVVPLQDEALSVSAVWGRSFQSEGKTYGHVIDPRSGQPVAHSLLAAVSLASATETDALSTALLTLGAEGLRLLGKLRAGARALLLGHSEGRGAVQAIGIDCL